MYGAAMELFFMILGAILLLVLAAALWERLRHRKGPGESTVEVTPERLAASKRAFDEKRVSDVLGDKDEA